MEFSDISGAIESISALKNELAQAMVDIGTNSDKINSLIGSIDGILKNETVLNETIVDLQGKTDSIRDEIMSKLDESDESLKGINDAIVDIKDSLAQTTTESNEKISNLLKELESINEKIVNKEDFKKELKKVEQHISSLNTEIDSTLQILSDLGAKVYDLDEEAAALHLKNVEQDKTAGNGWSPCSPAKRSPPARSACSRGRCDAPRRPARDAETRIGRPPPGPPVR